MASIKPLSEAVHSSVRSSIILFDLSRVVEELIYNSLDAGATKVSVFIGVAACYVKVVDNGSGITRDGLVLLGERYATSKLQHWADMDTAKGSFGFRGEALGSISDASLLEVVTKAHGRPNGYRKVMKGCKCLYLGIDDDRQDVGTTVIARDLFYNQPVRRKHMQSSPKKALHSVKNCVLLIALVHTQVSFKVVDVESEEELLYTQSSSSPLSLLRNAFGIEVSSSLRELNLSDGIIKLSGYMSSPSSTVSVKAFQYVYINSRIVCKCPIHKLLNQLASRFRCLDPLKIENAVQNRKNRSLAHPSYILNFSCPWSYYDLTFEPSKTSVAFKDWSPILKFIEGSIIQFWSGEMGLGKSSGYASDISRKDESWEEVDNIVSAAEDFSKKSETAEKLWKIKNQQASIGCSSTPVEMLTRECHMPDWKDDRILCLLDKKTAEFNEQQTESVHRTECSFKLWDTSPPKCISTANQESDIHHWTFDNDVFSAENNSFENDFTATERFNDYVNSFLGSSWGEEPLEVDHSMSNGSTETALSYDCFELSNVVEVGKELKKPFLQSCSSRENRQPDGGFVRDERCEIQSDGLRTKRKRFDPDDKVNVVEVDESRQSIDFLSDGLRTKRKWLDPNVMVNVAEADESSQSIDFFSRSLLKCEPESGPSSLWQGKAAGRPSPRFRKEDNMYTQSTDLDFFSRDSLKLYSIDRTQSTDLDFFSRDSLKLFSLDRKRFAEEDDFPPNSVTEIGSGYPPLNSEWEPVTLEPLVKSTCWEVEHFNHENALEGCLRSGRYEDFANYDSMPNSSNQGNCSSSCTNNDLDIKGYAAPKRDFFKFLKGRNRGDSFCSRDSDVLTEEPDWPCLDTCSKDNTDNFALSFYRVPSFSYIDKDDHRWELHKNQDYGQLAHKERSMRSCSAPPFYRGKKKVLTLNDRLSLKGGITSARVIHEASTLLETSEFKRSQQSFGAHQLHLKTAFVEDSLLEDKSNMKKRKYARPDVNEIQEGEEFDKPQSPHIHDTELSKDFITTEIHHSIDTWSKWRNSCSQGANGDESDKFHHQCDILDISSGILHLAGDSLVPESISKRCLEDAKVLQQVDKKFIPIVATGTLAIIDQHAADERIRLEELRQKVLSGQAKTINYLDSEQELVLPEIAYQLLHNYTEQIQNWGWICNIHDQGVESFTKNLNLLHRRPTVVTLLAVPCILGVNLTDVDLLEYLQQLADTDGSSTMPPSVLRILNFKACRGAIMFGDSLLPSECSLIVEELKRTSLCFQCAHGRPTTIPLVKLEDLHKQIVKVGLLNDASNQAWHGLVRQEICLDRATQRLKLARG